MKKNNLLKKRFFSIILTIAVALSMMPTMAWAVETETTMAAKNSSNNREYATLQAAIKDATDNATIQLMQNVEESFTIESGNNYTIDLNGYTWSGDGDVLQIKQQSVITIKNGKLASNTGRGIYMGYSEVTLGENMIVQGADGFSAIEIQYGSQTTLNLSDGTVLIRGLKVPSSKTIADYLPSGKTFVTCDYDDTTGKATVNSTDFVTTAYTLNEYTGNLALVSHEHQFTDGTCTCGAAYIAEITSGEQKTFVKTLNSNVLQKSGELKLLNDAEITYDYNKTNYTLNKSGQNLTIDLNGHALTGNLVVGSDASLTMKDGTTNAEGKLNGYLQADGGNLTVESGSYLYAGSPYDRGAIKYYSGSLNISGGTFKRNSNNSGSSALRLENTFADGAVSITGGTFEGIYVSGKTLDKWYALTQGAYRFQKNDGPLTLPSSMQYFDDTVTVVKCTLHSWETEENKSQYRCSYCGAINPNGLPEGTIAKIGTDKFYTSLGDAVAAVIAGEATGEITLVADTSGDNITVSSGNVTINLNGKTWRNKYTSGNEKFPALTVEEGTVTVKNGSISASKDNTVAPAVIVNGGTLTVQENVILSGTASHGTTGGNEPALVVNGGKVNLAVGTILNNGIKVTADGKAAADYLPANAAFQCTIDGNAELIDGFTTKSTFDNLTVVAHPNHEFGSTTGKCPCGKICEHSYVDGICSVCQYACPHESIDSTFRCTVCNAQMTVKITKGSIDTYAASLAAAVNAAESGSTLTLLAEDIPASSAITGGKSLTLDFNGKSLKENSGVIEVGASDTTAEGSTGNALTITGTSEDAYRGNSITVYGQNQFYTKNWSGTLNIFTANQNVTGSINSGSFRKFSGNNVKWSTLIAADHAFYNLAGTSFVYKYSDYINNNIGNTKIMACTHPSVERGYCVRCHAGPYAAEVNGSSYYETFDGAIAAAKAGDTVKLLANVSRSSLEIQGDFTLDLNGYKLVCSLTITSGTPKLINPAGVNGEISNLKINSDATLANLLPEGWAFKVDGNWATAEQLAGKTAARIKVVQAPITSLAIEGKKEVEYGQSNITLTAKYTPQSSNDITFAWYKVTGETTQAITDAVGSTYTLLANLDAGTYTYRLTITTSDGYSKSCDFTLTVKPADLSGAAVTIIKEPTYNGTAQQPEIAVNLGETKLLEGTDYKIISKPITDCTLESEARLLLEGTGNYTGYNSTATWQLKPATLTYNVTALAKKYGGTNNADVKVTFNYEENWIHLKDGDYTVTANYENGAAGENKTITGTVKLKYPQIAIPTTRNYILADESFTTTGSISKNSVTDPQAVSLMIANGVEKTYKVELPALPELGEGCEYGDKTYKAVVNFNKTGYYESGMAVEDGILTLPIKANATDFTGEIGTVAVTVETANYKDITLTVNISATNKIIPQLDGELTLSTKEITYGDKLNTIEISGKMKDGETPVDGTFAWQNPNNAPDANNAYTADWIFTPKDSEKYEEVTGTATIVVKQAKPTGEPKYEKISTGGKTLAAAKLTTEGGSFSVPGTLKWTLDDTTEVKQGIAYEWVYTPDNVNYETITGAIVLWAKPSSNGGGSIATPSSEVTTGDKTGQTGEKATTSPTEVKTETKTDTSGNQVTTVTVTVSEANKKEILKQAEANKSDVIIIKISEKDVKEGTQLELILDKSFIEGILNKTDADLTIQTPDGEKTFTQEELAKLAAGAADGTIVLTQDDLKADETPQGGLTPAQQKTVKGVRGTTIVLKTKLLKNGKIRLTWTKSKDYKLDYLEVYRSTKKNSGYGKKPFFTAKDGSTAKYLNTKSLKKGKTYYYKLRGVRIIDGKKYYTKWSNKTWKTVK